MAKANVTIREVAQRAGVSVSTVSRVLSGNASHPIPISQETRQLVMQAAKELAYRPHPGARLLRSKTTNLVGLIVREVEDPFFTRLTLQIRLALKARGLDLVLGYAEADPREALILSEVMTDLRYCDGLILAGDLQESEQDMHQLSHMSWDIPLVQVCRGSSDLVENNPSVSTDNRAGVRMALDYLVGLGHQHIAFLGGGRPGDLQERQQAYRDFMLQRFGNLHADVIQPAENSLEGGRQGMQALLSLPNPPTAVFASDDTMAIGAQSAAFEHGLRVPQDLSLVGFDDIAISQYLTPPLTTVRQPVEAISQQAVALLVERISAGDAPKGDHRHISLLPELVVRSSCQAITDHRNT
jgi:DNA-binding LacI/PurR family transcriptional regulator